MLSAFYQLATNDQVEHFAPFLKHGLKALDSDSGTLQMDLNEFLFKYRKMSHVT